MSPRKPLDPDCQGDISCKVPGHVTVMVNGKDVAGGLSAMPVEVAGKTVTRVRFSHDPRKRTTTTISHTSKDT